MINYRGVFLPTTQHTGTWFLIDFFRSHSMVEDLVEIKDLIERKKKVDPNKFTIIQTHVGRSGQEPLKHTPQFLVQSIINYLPSVTPLRDPIRSLISRQIRHPDLTHEHIIKGFEFIASLYPHKIIRVPVDLPLAKESRYLILQKLLQAANLPEESYVKEYAKKWEAPSYNITGEHQLKDWYKSQNFQKLYDVFPKEISMLKKSNSIKEMLERSNYHKCSWWWEKIYGN